MAGKLNPELEAALKLHDLAAAAVEAHKGPADLPPRLVDAESRALEGIAAVPCATDEEFKLKIRYLLSCQKVAHGKDWASNYAKEILQALALHFLPPDDPDEAEDEQRAPSKVAEIPEERILHIPSRETNLGSLEDHLRAASAMSRALWLAAHYADASKDERDHDAILELSNAVADMASAALFIFLKTGGRNG